MKRILQNFSYLTAGKVAGDLFTFVLFVALTRTFGDEGIGQYSIAMAIGGFVLIFADFGLHHLTVKELSRRRGEFSQFFSAIMTARIILALITSLFLFLLIPLLPLAQNTKIIVGVIGVYHVVYALMNGLLAVNMAYEEMFFSAFMEFLLKTSIGAVGIALIFAGNSLLIVTLSMLPLALGLLAFTFWRVTRKYGAIKIVGSNKALVASVRDAVPFALASLFQLIFRRVDILLLGFLISEAAAGVYNVAFRVVLLFAFIPYFVSMAILPAISRLYINSPGKLKYYYRQAFSLIILLALPASAGLSLIGADLIVVIYGQDFAAWGWILQHLAWLILLESIINVLGIYLVACDQQRVWSRLWLWSAISASVVIYSSIHFWGLAGGVYGVLLSYSVTAVFVLAFAGMILGLGVSIGVLGVAILGVSAFWIPFSIVDVPMYLTIGMSVLIYSVVLFAFRGMISDPLDVLTSAWRGERHDKSKDEE